MAQSAIALELEAPAPASNDVVTDTDLKALLVYQKLAQYRDTILAGKHPLIKLPTPTAKPIPTGPSSASSSFANIPTGPKGRQRKGQNAQRSDNVKASVNSPSAVAVAAASTNIAGPASGVPVMNGSGNPEIDPIFLEKSEDLVRAELRIQRQRLEKSLREELEQRKASAKAAAQEPESLLEFNLSDILVKALTLVQASSAPLIPNLDVAGKVSDSSDPSDNDTFYSSRHDTPDPRDPTVDQSGTHSTVVEDPVDHGLQDDPYSPTQNFALPQAPNTLSRPVGIIPNLPMASTSGGSFTVPPGLGSINPVPITSNPYEFSARDGSKAIASASQRHGHHEVQYVSSGDSGANSRSGESGNAEPDRPVDLSRATAAHYHIPQVDYARQPSPLIRAHDLSPYAPQPAHVSPLAFGQQDSILENAGDVLQRAPAAVAALRHEGSAATSPESSPQVDKGSKRKDRLERKKEKRKKKARERAGYGSPDVKPEPRSPSPIAAPTRPAKRQRSDRDPPGTIGDTLLSGQTSPAIVSEHRVGGAVQVQRVPYTWERLEEPLIRSGRSSVVPSVYRPDQPQMFERRYDEPSRQYVRRVYDGSVQYVPDEPQHLRSATYSISQPEFREVSAYTQSGRMSVRPPGDRARSRSPVIIDRRSPVMAPYVPTPQPARVIVDQYGREYFEPPRPASVIHQSVVPTPRPREHEIMYEKTLSQAISRIPADRTFEENGIVYHRTSPSYGARRVVTQPEIGRPEYMGYRGRDYSTQPIALPREEYVEYRGVPEQRIQQEPVSGDYITRSISVRPQDGVPYYASRVQSIHQEMPPRHYAASVRPEARREQAIQRQQPQPTGGPEYDPRQAGQDLPPPPPPPQRAYSVRPPAEQQYYYERQPAVGTGMAYRERPRPGQPEVVYIEDPSRPVYR